MARAQEINAAYSKAADDLIEAQGRLRDEIEGFELSAWRDSGVRARRLDEMRALVTSRPELRLLYDLLMAAQQVPWACWLRRRRGPAGEEPTSPTRPRMTLWQQTSRRSARPLRRRVGQPQARQRSEDLAGRGQSTCWPRPTTISRRD
jgi:hypothetical protein